MIRFTVPGNPVPKERPRVVNGRAYTPGGTTRAELVIRLAAKRARVKPLNGLVRLRCAFYRDSGQVCDLDNLTKLVQDALNGVAYRDDRQIVELSALKDIDRLNPRTEVELEEVAPA